MRTRSPREPNAGFVLIAVLAVMALLSGMLVVTTLFARTSIDTALLEDEGLRSDALVLSATELAGYELFVQSLSPASIGVQRLAMDGGLVELSVSTESGKVDLNGSGAELLATAYRASGLRGMTPETFAARVIDWRDPDSDTTKGGAEAEDYQAGGAPHAPRNGAFRSVPDLAWMLGMSPSDIPALSPYVTVFNPRGLIDVTAASRELLGALPGATSETVAAVLSLRAMHPEDTQGSIELLTGQAKLIDAEPTRVYRVRMTVTPKAAARVHVVEMVMIKSVSLAAPYQIVSWVE